MNLLTNTQGALTLAKSYQPYGETLSSMGNGSNPFAFTGEQTDVSGLTYLRARYYSSGTGRFLTRDTWMGEYNRPLSLNRWAYVEENPINRRDPSGQCWYPNLQTGGLNFDLLDPSSGICSWFIKMYQQNGVTIPTNATPDNWLDSIPPYHQRLIFSNGVCINETGTSLSAGTDFWMVILYSTSS